MRRSFSSYGPVDTEVNYYVPRQELIDASYLQVVGENPKKSGHYITVWAPRQAGKSWVMQRVLFRLFEQSEFDVMKLNLENLKQESDVLLILDDIARQVLERLGKPAMPLQSPKEFETIFSRNVLDKPLILIMDEFDALPQEAISAVAGAFRNIYLLRRDDPRPSTAKEYLLHGVALIGVRSVLGIENKSGSPFNVQRSIHIPNLTFSEVKELFEWHERESEQRFAPGVIERLYQETCGQPGITCWIGELMTQGFEDYRPPSDRPFSLEDLDIVLGAATFLLPNSTIVNMISKARQEPYKPFLLDLFRTDEHVLFAYDNPRINFLYMNGIIDQQRDDNRYYIKFSSPFIQKRLFNYFADELFHYTGKLHEPFQDLSDVLSADGVNVRNLMRLYEDYLKKNRHWLLEDAPKRKDLRIYEAVFHFNLYRFLFEFFRSRKGHVYPEFPTGNGKIDLLVQYQERMYGLELKTFSSEPAYHDALRQAAEYGRQLGLEEIALILFVEYIDETNRAKYERVYQDSDSKVTVTPVFVATGN